MRVKHKKWADPLIAAHPELMIDDATQFKGKWQSRFAKEQPLHLEVGMGKGSPRNQLYRSRDSADRCGNRPQKSARGRFAKLAIDLWGWGRLARIL